MRKANLTTAEYRDWLKEIKQRVRQAQVKAAVQVNTALLTFYWELGADIVERQKTARWGSGFLKQLSKDLIAEFPDVKGFSYRNIKYIRSWYLFYSEGLLNWATACCPIEKHVDKVVVEYALSDIHKPMGVSEYQLTRALPDNLKPSLPSIEALEAAFGDPDGWEE